MKLSTRRVDTIVAVTGFFIVSASLHNMLAAVGVVMMIISALNLSKVSSPLDQQEEKEGQK